MNHDATYTTTPVDWSTASDQEVLEADLIVALGLTSLADEDKQAMINRMTQTVQKAVALRVMDQLSDDQRKTLTSIIDQQQNDQLEQFLNDYVPNFTELVEQETISFKRAMLTGNLPQTT